MCNDANPCTTDTCSVATGACQFANNTGACTDGDACTVSDLCNGGTCVPGTKKTCVDNNVCTDDSCNTGTGACVYAANAATCTDGNACTEPDGCKNSACAPGAAKKCDDGNACTADSCSASSGCVYSNLTSACDDGNACTVSDVCAGGTCKPGAAKSCDDNSMCTTDSCSPSSGCVNKLIAEIYKDCGAVLDGKIGGDGVYCIDPDGAGANFPVQTYCDIKNGGWTLMSHRAKYTEQASCSLTGDKAVGAVGDPLGKVDAKLSDTVVKSFVNPVYRFDGEWAGSPIRHFWMIQQPWRTDWSAATQAPSFKCTVNSGDWPTAWSSNTSNPNAYPLGSTTCKGANYSTIWFHTGVGGCAYIGDPVKWEWRNLSAGSGPEAHVNLWVRSGACLQDSDCNDKQLCTTDTCDKVTGACSYAPVVCPDDGDPCTYDACEPTDGGCVTGGKFVQVPASSDYGTSSFCVAQYEMKVVGQEDGATPVPAGAKADSRPTGTPWLATSASEAAKRCAAIGPGFQAISSIQWQVIARSIESVDSNWSGGAVGVGNVPRGHSDLAPLMPLAADPADPCAGTGNAACADPKSGDFLQRRTHALANGKVIWDLAGNVAEHVAWVVLQQMSYGNTPAVLAAGANKFERGPKGNYSHSGTWDVQQISETYVYVEDGGFAVVDGKNFAPGKIWLRPGAVLFVRGSNYSADLAMEAGSGLLNSGSNIYGSAKEVSAKALVEGSISSILVKEQSTLNCGGTCPVAVTSFKANPNLGRGLGWAVTYPGGNSGIHGGSFGFGPMSGIFSSLAYASMKWAGFRCVREVCKADSDCSDGSPCTDDSCAAGVCKHVANTAPCDDGNPCTENDTCAALACKPGSAKSCNDFDLCTSDSCDVAKGCVQTPKVCNDSQSCTADSCDGKTGNCVYTPIDFQSGECAASPVADPKLCGASSIPADLSTWKKQVFTATGADQSFVVPAGVAKIRVKLWGAGGGSYTGTASTGRGGGGGFTYAEVLVTPGETLTIVAGKPGLSWGGLAYGGGGQSGMYAGSGGGRSAVVRASTELATAGGGGGGGGCDSKSGNGGPGGWPGGDGTDTPPTDLTYGLAGTGATAKCGGKGGDVKGYTLTCPTNQGAGSGGKAKVGGSTIQSSHGQGGGGGGGGWYGGGSGGGDGGGCTGGGGGGGSCWADPAQGCVLSGTGFTPAAATDPHYPSAVGVGGTSGSGGNGAVVVFWP